MFETKNKSIEQFLDELDDKSPTPGGGSVAALMGAQAAALIGMVCRLTIGKPQYKEAEGELCELLSRIEVLRTNLTSLIEADVDVFNRLMASYGMPKVSDEERVHRDEAVQAALKKATEVPIACAQLCAEILELSKFVAEKGSTLVVSDVGVAVMAAYAGLKSAALNVYINTGSIQNKSYVDDKQIQIEELLKGKQQLMEEAYEIVSSRLSGV